MINSSELRLGNWVGNGYIHFKVDPNVLYDLSVAEQEGTNTEDGYALFGIKLTPEILVKMGFKQYEQWFYKKTNILGGSVVRLKLLSNGKTFITWTNRENRITEPNFVKYVHQLQNLFFVLTGNELTLQP